MKRLVLLCLLAAAGLAQGPARGAAVPDPAVFTYQQRNGFRLPPLSVFTDADGSTVRIGNLSHGMPLILILGYFHCPTLCGIVRDDLFRALGETGLQAGRDYALVALSIDPMETTSDASAAKMQDLSTYGLPGADRSWHYLTGSASNVQTVADAIGFRDRLDQKTKQFIHPAGVVFVTSSGIVSSYLLGVGYSPKDIRSAVDRADGGGVAVAGAPILLLCFHFDPTTGIYTLEIMKLLRLAAALVVAAIAGALFFLFRREKTRV